MTSRTWQQLNNAPDLLVLESVTYVDRALVPGCFCAFAMGVFIWAPGIRYWRWMGDGVGLALAIGGPLGMLALWMLYRGFVTPFRWTADTEGLTARSLTRERRLKWSDVERVTTSHSLMGGEAVLLVSNRCRIPVPWRDLGGLIALQAAVWQHLRRVGKAEELSLSHRATSLWDAIPGEVCDQRQWQYGSRRKWMVQIWSVAVLFGVVLCPIVFIEPDRNTPFAAGLFATLIIVLIVHMLRSVPMAGYTCDESGIEGRVGDRRRRLQWNEVKTAAWQGSAVSNEVLLSLRGKRAFLPVPLDAKSDDSRRFVLNVISHLREAGVVVGLPPVLRASRRAAIPNELDMVDLRISATIWYILPCFFVFCGALALLAPARPTGPDLADRLAISAFCLAIAGLSLAWASRYQVTADSRGITKRTMLGARHIAWSDVVGFDAHRFGDAIPKLRIKPSAGKPLLVEYTYFRTLQWEEFVGYVGSKLAHLLPNEQQPSWLAQPWGSEQ